VSNVSPPLSEKRAMSPPQNLLKPFLQSARHLLATAVKTLQPISIVLGNESAGNNPPSPVSPHQPYIAQTSTQSPPPSSTLIFPHFILVPSLSPSFRAQIFPLRPELLHVLSVLQLSTSDLLCADDHPSFSDLNREHISIHLVDHNKLTLLLPGERVRGVIDHHHDEGQYTSASPRVITNGGSCASLVTRHFGIPGDDRQEQLAKLALAAILIDTANLCQKVTPHDVAAVEMLEKCILSAASTEGAGDKWDRGLFYEGIYKAKTRVGNMSLRDLLRKDYKEWNEEAVDGGRRKLGIASMVRGLEWLIEREGTDQFLEIMKKWGEERELDVLGVMTTGGTGEDFKRELLVWALRDNAVECVQRVQCEGAEGGITAQFLEERTAGRSIRREGDLEAGKSSNESETGGTAAKRVLEQRMKRCQIYEYNEQLFDTFGSSNLAKQLLQDHCRRRKGAWFSRSQLLCRRGKNSSYDGPRAPEPVPLQIQTVTD
jgi:exopolyphosphatase